MKNGVYIPAIDHTEPGFCELGSGSIWSKKYREWLIRRGFHDEVAQMDRNSRFSKATHENKKKRKNTK